MPVHQKVKAGTLAAAVSGLVVWALGKYVLHGHVDAVITAEIYAAVPAVLTFAAGYLTPAKKPAPVQIMWAPGAGGGGSVPVTGGGGAGGNAPQAPLAPEAEKIIPPAP
jgi:hypothetical protein